MNAVFADSFYFLALLNLKDKAHRKAWDYSTSSSRALVTSTWILMEVGDALCRGIDRAAYLQLLDHIAADHDALTVPAKQDLFDKAKALFQACGDKDWSMTDCTSFVVMSEKGLTEALTGDHHFEQAGFIALLK